MARAVDAYFNGAVVAHAIATADALGWFERIPADGSALEDVAGAEVTLEQALGLLRVLVAAEVVAVADLEVQRGPLFNDVVRLKGFFTWMLAASGHVLVEARDVMRGTKSVPARDAELVARAATDFGRRHIDGLLLELPELRAVRKILDIGCGDAARLLELAHRYGISGVGIDLSCDAIRAARRRLGTSVPRPDVTVAVADAARLREAPVDLADVDLIYGALMGHDLWPRDRCVEVLASWHDLLPRASTFVLCETVRATDELGVGRALVPTLGYEWLHTLMGQYIPSRADWEAVFRDSGWRLDRVESLATPASTMIFVCRR